MTFDLLSALIGFVVGIIVAFGGLFIAVAVASKDDDDDQFWTVG